MHVHGRPFVDTRVYVFDLTNIAIAASNATGVEYRYAIPYRYWKPWERVPQQPGSRHLRPEARDGIHTYSRVPYIQDRDRK